MASDYTDDLFRDLYFHEWERKDKHDTLDTFLLAAITVLGGIAGYWAKITPVATAIGAVGLIFLVLFGAFAVPFVGAVYCLSRSILPRDLGYSTDPIDLGKYVDNLRAFYGFEFNQEAALEQATESELRRRMRDVFSEAGSFNRRVNQEKAYWQSRAKKFLVLAVGLLVVNSIPTFVVQYQQSTTQAIGVTMSDQAKPPKPVKPAPPKAEILNESQRPKQR